MLMANVLAQIDSKRTELENCKKDKKRIDKLIAGLQDQRARLCSRISDLEYKIEELEDELDA